MIEKVRIRGFRKFHDTLVHLNPKLNIFVGDNGSGKSTILEAVGLAITGRVEGKRAQDELNPYWFNSTQVSNFFELRAAGDDEATLPQICIEVFLQDLDILQRLNGAHNSEPITTASPGLKMLIAPDPDYAAEIETFLANSTSILPVEYYRVEWRSFADELLTARPKEVTLAIIDSRTIRSGSGVDFHLREMLAERLTAADKAAAGAAYRVVKAEMTASHLTSVNEAMSSFPAGLHKETLSLAMDQTARSSWESAIVPYVAELPFGLAGQGQQAAVKVALAMGRSTDSVGIVLIEEPENHLSHTSLNVLLDMIKKLAGDEQQLLVTTHSSFVLNRLGLDTLHFVSSGLATSMSGITTDTVAYFKKLPGFDTLRMVLCEKFVVVEGPSDEIIFERLYKDRYGKRPIEDGVDVLSMRGLSLRRCLELAKLLGKACAAIRDIDLKDKDELQQSLEDLLGDDRRMFVSDPAHGPTLEPQLVSVNTEDSLRQALDLPATTDLLKWMTNRKTEAALRLAEAASSLTAPSYLVEAIGFIHDA